MLLRAFVVLMLVGGAAPARADKAADLIAKGERLFAQKQYAEATTAFRLAVNADKKNGLARFHWARGMAALTGAEKACELGITTAAIMTQVQQAVKLEPALRDRVRAERSFGRLHGKFAWHLHVLGRSLDTPADVDAILRGVEWNGRGNGVCHRTYLRFKEGGLAELWVQDVKSQDTLECGKATRRAAGTYTVQGVTVTVKYGQKVYDRKIHTGKLGKGGQLHIAAEPGPYADEALECAM